MKGAARRLKVAPRRRSSAVPRRRAALMRAAEWGTQARTCMAAGTPPQGRRESAWCSRAPGDGGPIANAHGGAVAEVLGTTVKSRGMHTLRAADDLAPAIHAVSRQSSSRGDAKARGAHAVSTSHSDAVAEVIGRSPTPSAGCRGAGKHTGTTTIEVPRSRDGQLLPDGGEAGMAPPSRDIRDGHRRHPEGGPTRWPSGGDGDHEAARRSRPLTVDPCPAPAAFHVKRRTREAARAFPLRTPRKNQPTAHRPERAPTSSQASSSGTASSRIPTPSRTPTAPQARGRAGSPPPTWMGN